MKKLAFVFPGQGSQKVGMGREWAEAFPAARDTFAEADEALGQDLTRLCWEGPEEELNLTVNTQPAILACSVAIWRAIADQGWTGVAYAGHSLGEYSALVASGALELGAALRLVRERGRLMQEAVPVGEGAMAAVIGLDDEALATLVADAGAHGVCTIANLNSPGQTVVAGEKGAVEWLAGEAKGRGARKAQLLAVSAPFHSPLMRPAREGLAPLLAATEFRDPAAPVVTNIDAAPVTEGAAARDALERQVDGPVRWVESMRWLIDEGGIEVAVEVGSGTVLSGLGRRIDRGVSWVSLPQPQALEKVQKALEIG